MTSPQVTGEVEGEMSVQHDLNPSAEYGVSTPPKRRVIWKFGVPILDTVHLALPAGAQILSVQAQDYEVQLWALVDPDAPSEMRRIHIIGTGNPAEPLGRFINTFQMANGAMVWHAFEAVDDGALASAHGLNEQQRLNTNPLTPQHKDKANG
jgi:hypothetical protein